MLHNRRRRLQELAAAEAQGQSFWTDEFDEQVRTKIAYAFEDATEPAGGLGWQYSILARKLILRDEGIRCLISGDLTPLEDFEMCVRSASDEMMPTVVEAMTAALSNYGLNIQTLNPLGHSMFERTVRAILSEHRVSYELIDGRMVGFSSRELHVEVVEPVLTLLGGQPGWAKVESAYQDALQELARGEPGDSITDAGTALQEALVFLGCDGNALGPLIKSARTKGLLAPHDSPMVDAIDKLLSWVSADRSVKGDAHNAVKPAREDAWLTVHVVGALLLRLSKATGR